MLAIVGFLPVFVCLMASEALAGAESSKGVEDSLKQLVVMVESTVAGQERIGAGIIVGFGSDQIYIVTADHIVRQAAQEAAEVKIRFYWSPEKKMTAKLLAKRDTALDLAVLGVGDVTWLQKKLDELPFDRLGDPKFLQRGDPLYLLGNPNGKSWRINTTPERFAEMRKESVEFESNLIAPGHSGGALLNGERELVGMLKSDQAPYGEAVSIAHVVKRLRDWNFPIMLRQVGIQLSTGDFHTCVVFPDGMMSCLGEDTKPGQGIRFKSISGSGRHLCGTAMGGVSYCVGNNSFGELGNGASRDSNKAAIPVQGGLTFVSLSAGDGHTCGVTVHFSVYCWGRGRDGQLGNGLEADSLVPVKVSGDLAFKSVSAGTKYTCALTVSGTLYCWGIKSPVPEEFSGPIFMSISAGLRYLCGVTPANIAYCAGSNQDGQLGIGTDMLASGEFVPVAGGLTFKSVSASFGRHTCGITTTEVAYCWGANERGQLGDGSKQNNNRPVAVLGGLKFSSISAGMLHTCGVTTEDSVYCWGSNHAWLHQSPSREITMPVRAW
jgi:hypothetical protein